MLGLAEVNPALMMMAATATTTLVLSQLGHVLMRWVSARRSRPATSSPRAVVASPAETRARMTDFKAWRKVAPVKAAQILIQFMQDHDETGYYTAKEIDKWWQLATVDLNLAPMHETIVRSKLAEIPGVHVGVKRLNQPEFVEVKARTKRERAVIYRIPVKGRFVDGAVSAEQVADRKSTGKRPANPKKRVLSTPAEVPQLPGAVDLFSEAA